MNSSAAAHGSANDLIRQVRALAGADGQASRFAYAFEDAAALFGRRLVIHVDPQQLERQFHYEIESNGEKLDPAQFFLGSGDWGGFLQPIETTPVYIQAVQLKKANLAFRRTGFYRRQWAAIQDGRFQVLNHVKIDTIEKLDAYFRNYCGMLRRTAKMGIRRRRLSHIDDDPGRYRLNDARPLWTELSERDVGVAVDRDGRLHRIGPGKHRTAAAKVVGVARMPCEVRLVHVDWLRKALPQRLYPAQIIRTIRTLSLPPPDPGAKP